MADRRESSHLEAEESHRDICLNSPLLKKKSSDTFLFEKPSWSQPKLSMSPYAVRRVVLPKPRAKDQEKIITPVSKFSSHLIIDEECDFHGNFKNKFVIDLNTNEESTHSHQSKENKDIDLISSLRPPFKAISALSNIAKDPQNQGTHSHQSKENRDRNFVMSRRSHFKDFSVSSDIAKDQQNPCMSNVPHWVYSSLTVPIQVCELTVHDRGNSSLDIGSLPRDKYMSSESKQKDNTSTNNVIAKQELFPAHKEKDSLIRDVNENASVNREEIYGALNTTFMLESKSMMNQYIPKLDEGVYCSIIQQHFNSEIPNIARLYRVFVASEYSILDEEVMINMDIVRSTLNSCIVEALIKKRLKATRLQAYTWPVIARGNSAVIVGENSCGKTMGYVVPLLSIIMDNWHVISDRLPQGIGPVMVVLCSTWRKVRCTADCIVSLLPANTPLKIMTAWGGCGREEEVSTGKQVSGGCDILITTVPCFMRLLTGSSTVWGGGCEGATTTLKKCCHLVIDDADVTLQSFASEVKQIITAWGEGRRKCGRTDLDLQAMLVSSRWTELCDHLTSTLLPLLDPTIIMSSPCEAAIATGVSSYVHYVFSESEALRKVVKLITSSCVQKRNLVFVCNNNVAETLNSLLSDVAIYSVIINDSIQMWKLQNLVHEWHIMQSITMVVSEGAEHLLLQHDLLDAQTIFHTHLGPPLASISHRYGFMIANFVTDLKHKSVKCESHIILSECALTENPDVLIEINRICGYVPHEIRVASIVQRRISSKYVALCYYLKAYGSCIYEPICNFRHEMQISDIPHSIPMTGEVTFKVKRILSPSRYLVHIIQYREKAGAQCIDLSQSYLTLFTALQKHYKSLTHCEPLQNAKPGMLCVVKDSNVWTRAQIISVNHSKNTSLGTIFLIDEGKEMTVDLNSALALPSHLAMVPQLIVEVILSCIQPMDQDQEWTLQAFNFVEKTFAGKNSKFVGRVALALGCTLWLNPVIEFTKLGKTFIQRKSLREKLISERFGMDNPSHMESLQKLCIQVGMALDGKCSNKWKETLCQSLEKLNLASQKKDLYSTTAVHFGTICASDRSPEDQEQNNSGLTFVYKEILSSTPTMLACPQNGIEGLFSK